MRYFHFAKQCAAAAAAWVLVSLCFTSAARAAVSNGHASVRAPWAQSTPRTWNEITCSNCQSNTTTGRNQWYARGPGDYTVRFTGMTPAAGAKYVTSVAALGTPEVRCSITSEGPAGADFDVAISCLHTVTGIPTATRFNTSMSVRSGNAAQSYSAFARVSSPGDSVWDSEGGTPSITRGATGNYSVIFPQQPAYYQLTNRTSGVDCRIKEVVGSPSTATVRVVCRTAGGALTAGGFNLIHTKKGLVGPTTSGGTNVAAAVLWDAATGQPVRPADIGAGFDMPGTDQLRIDRTATGTYRIRFAGLDTNRSAKYGATVFASVTALGDETNECTLLDLDELSANVYCVNSSTAQPVNSRFYFLVAKDKSASPAAPYNEVTGWVHMGLFIGMRQPLAVSPGLLCGYVQLPSPGVGCIEELSNGGGAGAGARRVGLETWNAGRLMALAVAAEDRGPIAVYAIGEANRFFVTEGNVAGGNWPAAGNLGAWRELSYAAPAPGVTIEEMTYARSRRPWATPSRVVGRGSNGRLYDLSVQGNVATWSPSAYRAIGGVVITDASSISNSLYDLWKSDSTKNWTCRVYLWPSAASLGSECVPLPNRNGLPIVGLEWDRSGGRTVLTNQGLTNGQYLCNTTSSPATCLGDSERVHSLTVGGLSIACCGNDSSWPLLTHWSGHGNENHFMYPNARYIAEGETFQGDFGAFFAYSYHGRIYKRSTN